jgi:hypothetical protein
VCRRYLIVVLRPMPAAPLVVRSMYMAVMPGPMPAAVMPGPMPAAVAVASWCCRRSFQLFACACDS